MRQRADRNRRDAGPRVLLDVAEMDPAGRLQKDARAEAPNGFADHRWGHVVEKDRIGALRRRRLGIFQALHLDLDADQMRDGPPRRRQRLGDPPRCADPVLFDQDAVGERGAMIDAASDPDGVFLQRAMQGGGLPGVQDPGAVRGDLLHVSRGRRGDAGKPLQEIQRHALAAQQGTCGTPRLAHAIPGLHAEPLLRERHGDRPIDLPENLGRHGAAAEDAWSASDKRAVRGRRQGCPEGIAERSVLAQRGVDERFEFKTVDHERYRVTSSRFLDSLEHFSSRSSFRARCAATMSAGAFATNFSLASFAATTESSAPALSTSFRRRLASWSKSMSPANGRQTSMSFTTAVASWTGMYSGSLYTTFSALARRRRISSCSRRNASSST